VYHALAMETKLLFVLIVLAAGVLAGPAWARSMRLVNTAGVDASDVGALVATVTRGCKTDRDKMIALWAYIARNPFYHWCEARENPDATTEMGLVYDPIIAFNVYGTTICYQVVDLLTNLADAAGIAGRTRGLTGHRVAEVFYGGKWHLFDAQYDCAAYYVADDGRTVIDLAELCRDADKYIRRPKFASTPFYQFDALGGKYWAWGAKDYVIKAWYQPGKAEKADLYQPYIVRGHTMDLFLRRGERLVRRFGNEGKWFCSAALYRRWKRDLTQKWIDAGPRDPRRPKNTYANGELIYEPDWTAEANFRDGLHAGKNVRLTGGQVRPAGAGDAEAVFGMHSPYLIVGKPGKLDADGDSADGAVFQAQFTRRNAQAVNAVAVSTDNGLSWRTVWTNDKTGTRTVRLDLTNHVEGSYGYLVRVGLRGAAAVAKMKIRNSLFYSPVPLPSVKPGKNQFALRVREGHGVLMIRPDLADAKGWRRFFHGLKNLTHGPHYTRRLAAGGPEAFAVVKVAAPGGGKVERMTVHASFGLRGRDEAAEIHVRGGETGQWKRAYKADFSARNDKWRWDRSAEIKLDRPAAVAYVKIVLRPRRGIALNGLRIYAHYRTASRPLAKGQVRVRHEWLGDGKPARQAVALDPAGGTYEVTAKARAVENRSVTIEVAND